MKALTLTLALIAAAAVPAAARQIKEAGFGVIAGDPTGGSAKLWFDDAFAADFGAGLSGETALWADLLYHFKDLLPQPAQGKLLPYIGAGPRIETRNDPEFAIRTIAGLSWKLKKHPIELFAEAGPLFRMTPSAGVEADGGVGLRFYFGKR